MSKPDRSAGRPETLEALEAMKRRIVELEEFEKRQGQMEAALRDSEQRYRILYEENPSMYFTVDTRGTVLSVNPFGAEQLGYTVADLVEQPVLNVFHPEDRDAVMQRLQVCVDHPGQAYTWEFRKIHQAGHVIWVRELARAVQDRDGRTIVLIVCEDITSQKSVEDDVRRARDELERRVEERTAELDRQRRFLRQIIDVDPNFIFAKDGEGRFTLVNQAVADAYGTTVEMLTGKRDADFNPNQQEVSYFRQIDREVMDTLRERFIPEERVTDSQGMVRWMQTVKRPLRDEQGQATQVLGCATDITARREVEARLRDSEAALRESQRELRQLAGRLLTAQEDERRRLAREMHDDLTQRLAGIAMQASRVERLRTLDSDQASELIRNIRAELARLSTDVHALSRRLHPSILIDLGLVDAIAAECSAFSERGEIVVRFTATGVPDEIEQNTAMCMYRIAQEALRNIAKHAQTERARVSLIGEADSLTLTVEDDGIGFDATRARGIGLGLASMQERARLIRADFLIESRPGAGARIRVRADLPH